MQSKVVAESFLEFVNYAVSPFHAVEFWRERLSTKGFAELREHEHWELAPGGKYFFSRNQSTLFAFVVGAGYSPSESAFRIIGAHTDSPCPKLTPVWENKSGGFYRLNVQLYGGGLWHTWFDRELTLGGRIIVEEPSGLASRLVHIKRSIAYIPNLAIHLTTERTKFEFNKDTQFKPLFATALTEDASRDGRSSLLNLVAQEAGVEADKIRDLELCLIDSQPSALIGLHSEFISSPRLDNLVSTYCALTALSEASTETADIKMAIAFDDEEVGSVSMMGADSVVTNQVLTRIFETLPGAKLSDSLWSLYRRSWFISADMAHAIHPNYADKHQSDHAPEIHKGVVIKTNCNLRYATDPIGASVARAIGKLVEAPTQEFVVKNESPCGSTIGPLISSKTGIRVIDIGAPQFAMHSVRELMGTDDVHYYLAWMRGFFERLQDVPAPCALE